MTTSANLLSPCAAALARFYHAADTAGRVRRQPRQALKDKRGRHSTPISPAARWNQVRVCVRGDVGCKGNTGVTDQRVTCGRACARLCLRVSERNIHPLGYCELSAISVGLSFFASVSAPGDGHRRAVELDLDARERGAPASGRTLFSLLYTLSKGPAPVAETLHLSPNRTVLLGQ